MSDFYVPKLVHYISGSNDTFLHRLMGAKNEGDLITNLSSITLKPEMLPDSAEGPGELLALQLLVLVYALLGLTMLINEYLMRTPTMHFT